MKLLTIFICICIPALILASDDWSNFKKIYQKQYKNSKEENYRKQIFEKNLKFIEEHNKKYDQGVLTYKIGVNKIADLTEEELFPVFLAQNTYQSSNNKAKSAKKFTSTEIPESIDWRDYGVITPVSDQGLCNSCWAFAIVGTLEAHVGIYEGRTVSLSQQNLEECVYSNFSCNYHMIRTALEDSYTYIRDNGGIDTLESYPYQDYVVKECRYNPDSVGASIKDYVEIAEGDEEEMKRVVGTIGPITVAITSDWTWSVYQEGVYYNENCANSSEPFNHAVVVVGYGTQDGEDYWLVKNSWDIWFGDYGYIKMARNKENNCGIASYARYPVII